MTLWFALGCSRNGNSTVAPPPQVEPVKDTGSSSGGGGFVDENSSSILKIAADGLAKFIRRSSPEIYTLLPNGWTQEQLAALIEKVRYEPMTDRVREGRQLMFDYGKDKDGFFIVALKPFFTAYSSFPIKFAEMEVLGNLLKDVRLKLAHESAHHLGFNEQQAEEFGRLLLKSLDLDVIKCEIKNANDILDENPSVIPGGPIGIINLLIHRPSGLGLKQVYYISEFGLNMGSHPVISQNQVAAENKLFDSEFNMIVNRKIIQSAFQTGQPIGWEKFGNSYYYYPWEIVAETIGQTKSKNISFKPYPQKNVDENLQDFYTGVIAKDVVPRTDGSKYLTLETTNPGKMDGTLTFLKKEEPNLRKQNFNCRYRVNPILVSKDGLSPEEQSAPNNVADDDQSTTHSWVDQMLAQSKMTWRFEEFNKFIEPTIANALGSKLAKFYSIEDRGMTFQGCIGRAGIRFFTSFVSKAFELKDGRICAVGLSIDYVQQKDKILRTHQAQLAKGFIAKDRRIFPSNVACFLNSTVTNSDDLAGVIPEFFIKADENDKEGMCVR